MSERLVCHDGYWVAVEGMSSDHCENLNNTKRNIHSRFDSLEVYRYPVWRVWLQRMRRS